MSVTILELATHRLGRKASNGADFVEAELPIMGSCGRCGATVAAYNSCPTTTGYIMCANGCTDGVGFATVEDANAAIFEDE